MSRSSGGIHAKASGIKREGMNSAIRICLNLFFEGYKNKQIIARKISLFELSLNDPG
jgi:hypothetical protein